MDLDRDIICPCDYRDPDVAEYGACYCRLYVNKAIYESQNLPEVPERRPIEKQQRAYGTPATVQQTLSLQTQGAPEKPKQTEAKPTEVKKKLWYCKQCGYVVYREDPPYVCPICKAKREMFAEIDATVEFKG